VADETAEIEVTPLVKALTRTPTLFGVPYMFSMFNMVVTAVVFLVTKNLLSGFLILPIHAAGLVTGADCRAVRFRVQLFG